MEPTPTPTPPVIVLVDTPAPGPDLPVVQAAETLLKATPALYNNLKTAYYSGTRQIQYGDQIIAFVSTNQMREILAQMETELGIRQPFQRKYPSFSKGI